MIFILIIRASGWDHQVEHQGPQSYRSKSRTVGEKKFSAAVVRPLITLRFVAPYSVEHAISPPNRGLLISTSARPYCITPSIRLKKKVHTASRTLFFFFSSSKTTPSNIFLSIYFYPLPLSLENGIYIMDYGIIAFWIISISTSSWEIFLKNRNLRISQKRVILKKSTLEKKKEERILVSCVTGREKRITSVYERKFHGSSHRRFRGDWSIVHHWESGKTSFSVSTLK